MHTTQLPAITTPTGQRIYTTHTTYHRGPGHRTTGHTLRAYTTTTPQDPAHQIGILTWENHTLRHLHIPEDRQHHGIAEALHHLAHQIATTLRTPITNPETTAAWDAALGDAVRQPAP